MDKRIELHNYLKVFAPNVYYQPPSNIQLKYPCIIYNKSNKNRTYANDGIYNSRQVYTIMLVENTPDSDVADRIENFFDYCTISQYYIVDNLYHTTLNLTY